MYIIHTKPGITCVPIHLVSIHEKSILLNHSAKMVGRPGDRGIYNYYPWFLKPDILPRSNVVAMALNTGVSTLI